jgi:hypothetical protein
MPRATSPALSAAVSFALVCAFDVFHAVVHSNHVPLWSRDAALIGGVALAVIGPPAGIGFWVLCRLLGRVTANGVRAALGVVALGVVAGYVAVAVRLPAHSGTFLRRHLGLVCFLLLVALSASLTQRAWRRIALLAAVVVGVGVTLAAASGNVSYESTFEQVDGLRVRPVPYSGRLLLLGVDGLGWDTLQRWAEAHPNEDYQWFRERALMAPLQTLVPTASPRIWSSIATGVPPEEHGIIDFTSHNYAGLDRPRLLTPRFEGAAFWEPLLKGLGLFQDLPVSSFDLKKPPFWEIAARAGFATDVIAWWASWPAQPLPGRVVSDRFYFSQREDDMYWSESESATGLTFPPQLEREIAPLRRGPEQMTAEEVARFVDYPAEGDRASLNDFSLPRYHPLTEVRYGYTIDETWFEIAMKLIESQPPHGTMAAYFRGIDLVSHGAMRFSHLYAESRQTDAESAELYGETVCRFYSHVFGRLRKLIEKAGDPRVVIVSDHGFEHLGQGEFGHSNAPPGVFLALGAAKTGTDLSQPYHVYDVAPTLLAVRGFPASADMPGRPLPVFAAEVGAGEAGAGEKRALATYGYRLSAASGGLGDAKTDEEMMRLLKTLGYIQ